MNIRARRTTGAVLSSLTIAAISFLAVDVPPAAASDIATSAVRIPSGVTLVYTGNEQVGVEESCSYNTDFSSTGKLYTISGKYRATEPGTYTAIASLVDKAGSRWADGSTEDKSVTWRIDKAVLQVPYACEDLVYNGKRLEAIDLKSTEELLELDADLASVTSLSSEVASNSAWATAKSQHAVYFVGSATADEVRDAYAKAAAADEAMLAAKSAERSTQMVRERYGELYTASGDLKTNAGFYKAKLVLADPSAFKWADSASTTASIFWNIGKAPQHLKVTQVTGKLKAGKPTKAIKVSGFKGKVTYTKVSGSSALSIDKTTGAFRASGNAKAGTYKVKLKVKANGNNNYKESAKDLVVKLKLS